MTTHHNYIMQDQMRAKVRSIMAYQFQDANAAAAMPRPAVLILAVVGLNILVSALAG